MRVPVRPPDELQLTQRLLVSTGQGRNIATNYDTTSELTVTTGPRRMSATARLHHSLAERMAVF